MRWPRGAGDRGFTTRSGSRAQTAFQGFVREPMEFYSHCAQAERCLSQYNAPIQFLQLLSRFWAPHCVRQFGTIAIVLPSASH